MLRKLVYFLLAEVALCAGGYAMTLHFPEWSSVVWFGISGSALLGLLLLWLHDQYWTKPKRGKSSGFSSFDMPVLAAVEHMKQTVAHDWDSPDKAERYFWQKIHEQMSAGRLRVIGAEVQGGPLRRIAKRTLAKLTPVAVNVPESDTAPYGVRFDLIDEARLAPPKEHQGPLPGFVDLRLRKKDVYRLWPRTMSQNSPSLGDLG